jgi:hypothetical protein
VLPEAVQPVIEQVWIEPSTPDATVTPGPGGPVCHGDMVWVYAELSDPCGEAPERVELRTRYPPGADEESSVDMFAVDAWTYRGSLMAREAPGTLFYVYVEDAYGHTVQSEEQIYSVAPCVIPVVDFYASPATVPLCGCTRVYWSVEGVWAVYFEGDSVVAPGSQQVCPSGAGTTSYELEVVYNDGSSDQVTTSVTRGSQPSTSLTNSVTDVILGDDCLGYEAYCPYEVHIWYPNYDPYRCVGQQAIPQSIEAATGATNPVTEQIPANELGTVLATRLAAGDVPNRLVLVYPDAVIDGLDSLIADWLYYHRLYSWDQSSDTVVLLQYRVEPEF